MDPILLATWIGAGATLLGAAIATYQVVVGRVREKRKAGEAEAGRDDPSVGSASRFEEYREWLKGYTSTIDIRGIGLATPGGPAKASSLPLRYLYTPLHVRAGLGNWALRDSTGRETSRVPLEDLAASSPALVVLGDPGAGKTTFVRYLAYRDLKDDSNRLPLLAPLPDVYQTMSERAGSAGSLPQWQVSPQTFLNYFVQLGARHGLQLRRGDLLEALDRGRCVWLLDGLDELPTATVRATVVGAIEGLRKRWKGCQVIVTSRPAAVSGRAVPTDFELAVIDRMREEEIRAFLNRWSELLFHEQGRKAQEDYAADLFETISSNEQFRILARNPVMLTSMAVVHFNERRLPEGRADLLEAITGWLFRAKEGSTDAHARLSERIHRRIALEMFKMVGGRRTQVALSWVADVIAGEFENREEAIDFLGREEAETGLLLRRGEGDVSFWLLWFQEYLAAKEIAGRTDDRETGWWSLIADHLQESDWAEVIRLVPACLARLGTERVDLFFARLGRAASAATAERRVQFVGLGGTILRDLRVGGYGAANVSEWQACLAEAGAVFDPSQAGDLDLNARYEAAIAFSFSAPTRRVAREISWVRVPGGWFRMGSQGVKPAAENFDPQAATWEGPVAEVWLASFSLLAAPVTVEQFAAFVEAGGYGDLGHWSKEGRCWHRTNQVSVPVGWEDQLWTSSCPVTGISYFEAEAYCNWLTKASEDGHHCRLPTEAEWEYSYRRHVSRGRRFLWGENLTEGDQAEANWGGCGLRRKSPVGLFPESTTPDGLQDMIGNVEEWCASVWTERLDPTGGMEPQSAERLDSLMVVRGGSTIRFQRLCRPSYRSRTAARNRYPTIGFRVARVGKQPRDPHKR